MGAGTGATAAGARASGCSVGVLLPFSVITPVHSVHPAAAPPLHLRPPAHLQVAILCNHQRAVPKGHDGPMEKLQEKLGAMRNEIKVWRGGAGRPCSIMCWLLWREGGSGHYRVRCARAPVLPAPPVAITHPAPAPLPLTAPPHPHPSPRQELQAELKLARAGKPSKEGKPLREDAVAAKLDKKKQLLEKAIINAKVG